LVYELPAEKASFSIGEDEITRLSQIVPVPGIIGQPRALKALKMGTEIRAKGYNIFVTGISGTGKETTVRRFLEESEIPKGNLRDIALCYNFRHPERPKVLYFPPGKAREWKKGIRQTIQHLKGTIKGKLDNELFQRQRDQLISVTDRKARKELEEKLVNLQKEVLKPEIDHEIDTFARQFPDRGAIQYLEELKSDILDNHQLFLEDKTDGMGKGTSELFRYELNIIEETENKPPIVFENIPTYTNLFGTIDIAQEGEGRTNFTFIRGGAVIRSSGGILVLRGEDLLQDEDAWIQLKRVLQTGEVEIQRKETPVTGPSSIKPDPVKVDLKVIMLGSEQLYEALYNQDADFEKLFKVLAEFDNVMERTDETMREYIGFLTQKIERDKLLPLCSGGIATIMRYGVRLAENRSKLTTRFSMISDLLQEAHYWASSMGKREIDREAVKRAIEERNYLFNLPEAKLDEMIVRGEVLMNVSGASIGRVNGLAVYDRATYAFGSPCVISARIAPGNEGLLNIEREVGLSGEIHDKWVLILDGFLRSRYANTFPLSMYASICFEQSYGEVEGDSAASAEICALLSAISEIPLNQEIAVTGSINQVGEIQPVGGINEKIEGFYSICKQCGITGNQGVIIPWQNVQNLVLSDKIEEAISREKFHIYPVRTVDEAMTILTGNEAGGRNKKGVFPQGSINFEVEHRLRKMAESVKNFSS
jgi:lon-related putative ATP-dependent protease